MNVRRVGFFLCITPMFSLAQGDSLQQRSAENMANIGFRFLALGDSYTIGEAVDSTERWPAQLVQLLQKRRFPVGDPVIIAKTGWTTGNLMAAIEEAKLEGAFDLVSLLIGVNNQYRGGDVEEYRREFRTLLSQAIRFAAGRISHVVVLSIPDWGVTPFAGSGDRSRIAAEIDRFNAVNREESVQAGVHYVDITEVSRKAATDSSLVASDGLHPSGKMYSQWAMMVLVEMFPE